LQNKENKFPFQQYFITQNLIEVRSAAWFDIYEYQNSQMHSKLHVYDIILCKYKG
jgi:hypothetical protein